MSILDVAIIVIIVAILLMMGFPMMVPLAVFPILIIVFYLHRVNPVNVIIPQMIAGMRPMALTCIPLFILAADLLCKGKSARRLVDFVNAWVGHIPGGLAISTALACTLFGSVSGSANATVVAIGKPIRPALLEAGYPSSWTFGLIVSSATIAILIPPSINAIIYGVAAKISIGALFLAGVGAGVLVFVFFAIYCFTYSKLKGIGSRPKANWAERWRTAKGVLLLMVFPVIILGGIFTGTFTPTEAAAVAVAYSIILEVGIYREIGIKEICESALSAGEIVAITLILCGLGMGMSWVISYARLPQLILPQILGVNPSVLWLIFIIMITYLVACSFFSSIVVIFVFTPIFAPYVTQLGIDPVFLGALIVLQTAIGMVTPPFGSDLFVATAVFRRPYFEVVRSVPVFIGLMLLANVLIIAVPDIVMFLPNLMR